MTSLSVHENLHGNKISNIIASTVNEENGQTQEQNVNLILVLDVSGSMSFPSNSNENNELSKLTRLELVQHSSLCIIERLGPQDTLSIVTFSDDYVTVLPKCNMSPVNKSFAIVGVNSLFASGSTNLWAGLSKAFQLVSSNENSTIILLTDGEPTHMYDPKGGFKQNVKELCPKNAILHCCGLGPSLETNLLCEIAEAGNGIFNYISDGSMVGTVFVHFLANIKYTLYNNITLEFEDGSKKEIGSLRHNVPKYFKQDCKLVRITSQNKDVQYVLDDYEHVDDDIEEYQDVRFKFVETLNTAIMTMNRGIFQEAKQIMLRFYDTITVDSVYFNNLKDDIFSTSSEKGQICKALLSTTWGYPYLMAVYFSHREQIKVNFKDQSMLIYSNDLLEKYIKETEEMFVNIKPPAKAVERAYSRGTTINMGYAMCQSTGCFSGSSRVLLEDDTVIEVRNLSKGTKLKYGYTVVCLVSYETKSNVVCIEDDLFLTLWHPYKENKDSEWRWPDEAEGHEGHEDKLEIYNLVLDSGHIVETVHGSQCVTLGHNFTGPVVGHDYYGSEKCIFDLKKIDGYENGLVVVKGILRNDIGDVIRMF